MKRVHSSVSFTSQNCWYPQSSLKTWIFVIYTFRMNKWAFLRRNERSLFKYFFARPCETEWKVSLWKCLRLLEAERVFSFRIFLYFFIRNCEAGWVVSKTEMFEIAWGRTSILFSNISLLEIVRLVEWSQNRKNIFSDFWDCLSGLNTRKNIVGQ